MALPLDELETATRRHFMPVIQNQIFQVSPLLHRIFRPSKAGQWGLSLPSFDGRSIAEPLEYAESTTSVGAYKSSTTWGAGTTEVLTVANYPWRMYYVGIKIHNKDIAANAGKERVFDIAAVKLQNAVKVLRKSLATDLYLASADGDANERMIGLQAITATDQTVGGIDQSSYAWWEGWQDTAQSNRDLTWTILNDGYYNTKKYGAGDKSTIIVCSDGVLQNYENLLTKTVSATGGSTDYVGHSPLIQLAQLATSGPKTIDGGFEAFSFKRIPMVSDPFAPVNKLFFLNENYLNWRVLKNFDSTGWVQLRPQGNDWAQNVIFGYGALTSSANRKQGIVTHLTEA